ncbi:hypothetical protein ACJRPK_10435 [Aquimarina sp. 2-A2]
MKKFFYLIGIFGILNLSCEKDPDTFFVENEISQPEKNEINSFDSWDEFHKTYSKYSKINDLEELEAISFYRIEKDTSQYSPALQAILNANNQFKINGEIIELENGIFKKTKNNNNVQEFENVGRVSTVSIPADNLIDEKATNLNTNNRTLYKYWLFYQQNYIDCRNGTNHGSAPRYFRYLHQVLAEYLVTGAQYNYSLYLRLYLEYNHRSGSWRLSGERREISINVTDRSRLPNPPQPDQSGNPSTYNLVYNNHCSSHQIFLLRWTYDIGPSYHPYWIVDLKGTIKQKMTGESEANRWTHYVSW